MLSKPRQLPQQSAVRTRIHCVGSISMNTASSFCYCHRSSATNTATNITAAKYLSFGVIDAAINADHCKLYMLLRANRDIDG